MARRKHSAETLARFEYLKSLETDFTQLCTICEEIKPLSDFHKKKRTRKGVNHACRTCALDLMLTFKYGIPPGTYDRLFEEQDGQCAICLSTEPGYTTRFHVDHDHLTGRVRGLLCSDCNVAIGQMREDPLRLRLAAEYLERHTEVSYAR